jgi:hypothetical protein
MITVPFHLLDNSLDHIAVATNLLATHYAEYDTLATASDLYQLYA